MSNADGIRPGSSPRISYAAKLTRSLSEAHALWSDGDHRNSSPSSDVYGSAESRRRSLAGNAAALEHMSWPRIEVAKVLQNQRFDLVMGFVILANVGVMIQETDNDAQCVKDDNIDACRKDHFVVTNYAFLGIYTIEAAFRLYVFRIEFFKNRWNLLDFLVVLTGYIDAVMSGIKSDGIPGPSMSILRIFRVLRLARVVRVFKKIPELYAMMRGFLSAMQSMFWGITMIIVLLMVWAILCVEMVHPISLQVNMGDKYCAEAFSSVWKCMLVFFQTLVAGDSWGRCTLPIIFDQPIAFVLFGSALVCVQLGFMNLILAVIVERARASEEKDAQARMSEKAKAEKKSAMKLTEIFKSIDSDDSGTISMEELLEGYENSLPMQHHLGTMDIDKSDLVLLFELMDADQEGELSYQYLIDSLRMTASQDNRKHLFMLRLQASEIARSMKKLVGARRSVSAVGNDLVVKSEGTPRLPGQQSKEQSAAISRATTPGRDDAQRDEVTNQLKNELTKQLDTGSFEKEMSALRARLEEQHELLMAAVNSNSARLKSEPPTPGIARTAKIAPTSASNSMVSIASSLAWEPANSVSYCLDSDHTCPKPATRRGNDLRLEASRSEDGDGPPLKPAMENKLNTADTISCGRDHEALETSGTRAVLQLEAMVRDSALCVNRGPNTGEVSL